MARILYAVADEGRGHAVRSRDIIEELQRHHDVVVMCGERSFPYLSSYARHIYKIAGTYISYVNNQVSNIGTVLGNLLRVPRYISSFVQLWKFSRQFKPDVIITDFEPLSAYLGLVTHIPVISLGNHHVITKTKHSFPLRYYFEYLKTKLVIKLITPTARFYVVTTFFTPALRSDKVFLVPPILRKEIASLPCTYGNFVLVYQTSRSNKKLFKFLARMPYRFVVYGLGEGVPLWLKHPSNLVFKPFSEATFFDDLANCAGVITNGGFTLMTEALFLKKPLLSIPVQKQFEQILNAYYLERLGKGVVTKDKKNILQFLEGLQFNTQQLHRGKGYDGNTKVMETLERLIDNVAGEKLLVSKLLQ